MSRPCVTCRHPERAAIEAALVRGDSLRTVAAAYGVSRSGLSRHVDAHVEAHVEAPRQSFGIRGELLAWLAEQKDPGAVVEAALERYRADVEAGRARRGGTKRSGAFPATTAPRPARHAGASTCQPLPPDEVAEGEDGADDGR